MTLAAALATQAQEGRPIRFYIAGGVHQAIGELREQVKTGYGGSAGLGLLPGSHSTGNIELVLRGQYDFFPSNSLHGPNISFVSGGLELKLNHVDDQSIIYYLLLGTGYSHTEWSSYQSAGTEIPETAKNNPYLSPGMGMEFTKQTLSPFVQVRLVLVSGQRIGNYYFVRAFLGIKL
jgi:hypothetical protein